MNSVPFRHRSSRRLKKLNGSDTSGNNISSVIEGQLGSRTGSTHVSEGLTVFSSSVGVMSVSSTSNDNLIYNEEESLIDDEILDPEGKISSALLKNNKEDVLVIQSMIKPEENIINPSVVGSLPSMMHSMGPTGDHDKWTNEGSKMIELHSTTPRTPHHHRFSTPNNVLGSPNTPTHSRTMNEIDSTISMKVVVIGGSQSGKSSIVHRVVNDEYIDNRVPTFGVDFLRKELTINHGQYRVLLNIWDISGHDSSMINTYTYYRGAKAALVVYDATSLTSLAKAIEWKRDLDAKVRFTPQGILKVPAILIGNRCDLIPYPLSLQWRPQKTCYYKLRDLKLAEELASEKTSIRKKDMNTTSSVTKMALTSNEGNNKNSRLSSSGISDDLNIRHAHKHGDKRERAGVSTIGISKDSYSDHFQQSASIQGLLQLPETVQQVQDFMNEYGFSGHFFVSAKMGENIEEMVQFMLACILKMDPLGTDQYGSTGERDLDITVNMRPTALMHRCRRRSTYPGVCCVQ